MDARLADDPHTKANLLFQAHFLRLELPMADYATDTKSVLDQAIRILQAIIDVAADAGWLATVTLNPIPYTLNPKPLTLNLKPLTLNP